MLLINYVSSLKTFPLEFPLNHRDIFIIISSIPKKKVFRFEILFSPKKKKKKKEKSLFPFSTKQLRQREIVTERRKR